MAEFTHKINVSARPDGTAAVEVTVTLKGTPTANASTITRAGQCMAELGRAITRISKKYDATTRRSSIG